MKDVGITIKVKDGEVKTATASVQRLKAATDDLSRSGGITGTRRPSEAPNEEERLRRLAAFMGSDVPKAAKPAADAIKTVESASSGAKEGLIGLLFSAGPLGAAFGVATAAALVFVAASLAVAAGTYAVTKNVVEAAKAQAEYAIETGNLSEELSISTEATAALRHETDAQGRSFSVVESSIKSFKQTLGEAIAGSADAKKKLHELGINATTAGYNVENAFKQALLSIVKAPNEIQQAKLAAFGSEGYKLLPFLKDFNGDVDKAIAKAKELGISISGDDVAAAREFNRAYADVQAQIESITYAFGRQFLPIVGDVMTRFSGWISDNESMINRLAEAAKIFVSDAIDGFNRLKKWIDDNPTVFETVATIDPVTNAAVQTGRLIGNYYKNRVDQLPLKAEMGGSAMSMDPSVMAASLSYKPKKEKAPELTEAEKQAKALQKIIDDLGREIEFFNDKTKVAAVSQQILAAGVKDLNSGLAAQAIALAAVIDKKQKDLELAKEKKKYDEEFKKAINEVNNTEVGKRVDIGSRVKELEQQIKLGRDLNEVEKARLDLEAALLKEQSLNPKNLKADDLASLIAKMRVEGEATIDRLEQIVKLLDQIKQKNKDDERDKSAKDFLQNLEDELDLVQRNGRELSVYEQVVREITRSEHEYTQEQKDGLLATAAQIDAVKELNRQHAELKDFFKTNLRYIFDGDFKGLLENWKDKFKDMFADKLADIFATSVLGFNPNQTNNPVAKPIVSSIDKTNSILNSILVRLGGSPIAGAFGGGGGFGSILGNVFGGGSFGTGSIGPGGTPVFNPNASSGGGGSFLGNLRGLFGDRSGTTDAQGNVIVDGRGGLDKLLSSPLAGMLKASLPAALIGLFVSSLSEKSPLKGALKGGLVGLIAGFINRSKLRRQEESIRNQGMIDAQNAIKQQFDALILQVRMGQTDPTAAITQGTSIGQSIRDQYLQMANSLKDKKTRNIALADVSRVDSLIAQKVAELKQVAEMAQASADRAKRILPEFAGGVYMSPEFRRFNGLISGAWTGRDYRAALIADAEMVLNPGQQNRVRQLAGFDVFAGAGIPNYPRANPSVGLAGGGIAAGGMSFGTSPIIVQPNFTLELSGVSLDDKVEAYLTSDTGIRTQIKVNKSLKERGDF